MNFHIHQGDALEVLRTLPDSSVNCCITSPPYWGLRDYGTATWEGGNPVCDHLAPRLGGEGSKSPINGGGSARDSSVGLQQYKGTCRKCCAVRVDSQIGLEATPAEYVCKLVTLFAEVRRVLRDDGTLWLNLGDSYASQPGQRSVEDKVGSKQATNKGSNDTGSRNVPGLKPKDLIGIPWRVALALQADGWWLRSDIIWHKPNPMPESVTDRPTKAHEYVFLLAKSERYYYDAEAIKETAVYAGDTRHLRSDSTQPAREFKQDLTGNRQYTGFNSRYFTGNPQAETRNKRSVWTLATLPTPEAHFATFPIELPETCLKAGCPEGGTVLDPFAGAGTTGLACLKNNRNFVGVELNPKYIEIAHSRARKYYPLLVEFGDDPAPRQEVRS